jgi:uncharacterized protein YggU (UPF0235/DUF167 family)
MTAFSRVQVRVSPGGACDRVVGRYGDGWKVSVVAAPEDGKANAAVIRLLATELDLPRRDVTLVSGKAARTKVVALTGIDAAETERRLSSASARTERT